MCVILRAVTAFGAYFAMKLECPQCKSPVAREGQRFCYRCGHELKDFYNSFNAQAQNNAPQTVASPPAAEGSVDTSGHSPARPTGDMAQRSETMVMGAIDIPTDPVAPAPKAEAPASLRILLPSGDVFDREIVRAEVQMGKGPRNDIVISDPAVSSTHAVIRFENGAYTVADIGSRNGTYVNSERISGPHKLKHGDVIGIGLSKITFRLAGHSETSEIEPAALAGALKPVGPPPLTEESLAQAIVAGKLVAPQEVERLRGPEARGRRLYRALVEEKLAGEDALRDLMSRTFQIPTIDLRTAQIDEAIAAKFSARLARERLVFPVAKDAGQLILAVADPTDTDAIEEVRREVNLPVQTRLATATEIIHQVDLHYGPKLIGVTPTGEKLEYPVNKAEIEIGKAAHNYIVLPDPTVSSTHAIILARDGGYSIVDMGSRNGTFVNGERLGTQAHTLKHGDTIQVGQTVLTFRNPAQTTANMTAVLSAEALAEVRKRAESLDVTARPAGADQAAMVQAPPVPIAPEVVAAPAVPPPANIASAKAVAGAPPAGVSEEEEKKKKKKKKKKEDERLKAAYVGAFSRVVAQVVGALAAAGLALSVAYYSMRPGNPGPGPGSTDPGTSVASNSRLANPTSPVPISGGKFEPSGVVHVPGSNGVLFVSDGSKDAVFWMQVDSSGKQVGSPQPIPLGVRVSNPEAITYDNNFWYYVVGSQSDPKDGGDNALARFAFDPASRTIQGTPEVIADLRSFLLERVPELGSEGQRPGDKGGLNVEGLAWDPIGSRLLVGLRSPLLNGQALLVAMKLKNPREPLSKENLDVTPTTIRLPLDGFGIRDIQYDEELKAFLIISGATELASEAEKKVFRLWVWDGEPASRPVKQADLDGAIKPEGVAHMNLGGQEFVLIVGDASSSLKMDYAGAR
ncbi:MAG TPA: DUF3616 domain-containing protein [Blastocatellia bacterium]|nr:DUF3616 domain-containing protein [Blastocatellia bacterium]